MTNDCSFDIKFEKFNKNIHIEFPKGLNIIYGESGSGKSKIIYSILNKANPGSANFSILNKIISESIQLVFQNPENQIICQNLQSELSFGLESSSDNSVDLKDELQKIKSLLPFIDDWLRHPSTLSGGEMEILNIVTAFTSKSEVVLIDDGLSYLNPNTKKQWVEWIKNNFSKKKTILWFTSDYNDLSFGKTKWILSLSDMQPHDNSNSNPEYQHRHINGLLSIKTKDLTFGFEASTKTIIDKLNINLSNARSVGIIGENGSGKTTLSQLISNSIKPLS